jgi:queuosine precursor transporter
MNESIFFFHALIILLFSFFSLKIGKKALITFISFSAVLANLFVQKQIDFFGLTITCTDVFSIGAIFSFNLLQEFYGKKEGVKAMKITFFLLLFFVVMSQIHLLYIPCVSDYAQQHYEHLLQWMPRLFLASIAAFFTSQYIDMQIFAYSKKAFPQSSFMLRSLFSMSISQFMDTILFTYLGLSSIVTHLWHVIAMSYLVKLAIILLHSFLSHFSYFFAPRKIS